MTLEDLYFTQLPTCRVCGCTDEEACEGGCAWVEDPEGLGDLCSSCLPEPSMEALKQDEISRDHAREAASW